jgi:hypothetical protein
VNPSTERKLEALVMESFVNQDEEVQRWIDAACEAMTEAAKELRHLRALAKQGAS